MSAIDATVGGFVRDSLELGENDVVYHNNYFTQLSVIKALAGWLPAGSRGGGGGDAEDAATSRAPDPADRPGAPEQPSRRQDPGPSQPAAAPMASRPASGADAAPPADAEAARRRQPGRRAAEPRPSDPRQPRRRDARRTSWRSMDFVVRVRLSRKAIEATEGTAHAGGARSRSTPTVR